MRFTKFAIFFLFVVAFVAVQANAAVQNLIIENASFEDDYTGWWEGLSGTAQATHEIDTSDVMDGVKCAFVTITEVSGTNWHVGITQNLTNLKAGTQYTADFFAKASVNRVISLELKAAPPLPYAWIGGGDIDITTSWAEYFRNFTPSVDYPVDAAAQICFWVGQVVGQVRIDGVRVYEGAKQDHPVEASAVEADDKLITTWAKIKGSH